VTTDPQPQDETERMQWEAEDREEAAYQRGRREATIECNTEIDRLHALLEQAEQYARDLQDDGVLTDEAREQGLAAGRSQATEGWEREWGVAADAGVYVYVTERAAREAVRDSPAPRPVVSRLVGSWEPDEQHEPAPAQPMVVTTGGGTPNSAPCCDLHGRNCEQGDECCYQCTEAYHFRIGHGGVPCSSPDLSAVQPEEADRG
jgi:hypothetical protein